MVICMGKRISKRDLEKVRELDLLTYFKNYEPQELIKKGRNDYITRTHSSLHLSNGLWCYWAKGVGGRSALDYLKKVEGWDLWDAARYILNLIESSPPVHVQQNVRPFYHFRLPKAYENNEIIKKYLIEERCIDKDIVQYCIDNHFIYEAEKDHSVVFVGYDSYHYPKYACKRATDDSWKKDVAGSHKQFSFSIKNDESSSLHVFESAIDLLSYMTLLKRSGRDYLCGNFLSIAGATQIGKSLKDSTVPVALESFLENHQQITHIYLHLDNDQAGKDATKKIIYHYKNDYEIYDHHPSKYKDFNDLLKNKVEHTKNQRVI